MAFGVDVECEAAVLRHAAGYDEDDAPGALAIAKRLGVLVRRVESGLLRGHDGCLLRVNRAWQVFVRRGLTPERLHWVVAHELGELRLKEIDYRGDDIELCAHGVAAALMMPRRSYRAAAAEYGEDLAALAGDYLTTQTAAARRLAEVGIVEMAAVVTPTCVYVHAPDDFVLPDLRKAAREGYPGLRRCEVTDARRRVALIA